ncbi:hypothetical protein D3C80_2132830 [compost metagenome]
MRGQRADEHFRAERGRAQLGMGEVEIVDLLGDVIGKLVGDSETEAERCAVLADHVEPSDFRLFAAVQREGRRYERRA